MSILLLVNLVGAGAVKGRVRRGWPAVRFGTAVVAVELIVTSVVGVLVL